MTKDWYAWHSDYDQPESALARRLAEVRQRVADALDAAPPGPLRALSLCAGQGRDLIPVLAAHARGGDVTARLVELDPRNADLARRAAADAGLTGVEVVTGDASLTDRYADLAPADLVLVCGVFGNIGDDDIRATVRHCASLCATGGTVLWTRHRREPDLVPVICEWFAEEGFEPVAVNSPADGVGVGAHRFTGTPRPLAPGARMFEFVGYDVLERTEQP
ncbi:class I SAM-dependent methyltransferase [Micromonospora tulbaghiae]|uniref:Class I SAM-dependent methyltransferase n=1 Tax=Micromonospora tulbaghiae TaxID=479978 RepID=A0AAW4JHC1_9ACTN|nr:MULTISPECIES: class I SAM-dependent methyltransferase [Micromonospora]KAB1907660.1 class I SAM-dependent methyltransferase [Micromonospora sp. AMSO1212t]MBO4141257.1 class I SAM-dependent methyltransferase [Micromonospora tulbaghiae]MDX5458128.1 class I SAM-dependent methyltransferase [Micromonospora tulbaghiae]SCE83529.1 Methyltransferase domain-containing protein [Micromonospora tulbaghiae]